MLVAAPHTSNWDLIYLLAIARALDTRVCWVVKHTVFWWPLGPILRAFGGIPIRRDRTENAVEQLVGALREAESMSLAIAPEGTRRYTRRWKSGFYHIAKAAGVRIQLTFADYARRQGGYGPAFTPSDDVCADMDLIRAFFADKVARHPEQVGEIRLLEEDE